MNPMGAMKRLDILRQEGNRTPEDFKSLGFDNETAPILCIRSPDSLRDGLMKLSGVAPLTELTTWE